jgi:hypothetical protein
MLAHVCVPATRPKDTPVGYGTCSTLGASIGGKFALDPRRKNKHENPSLFNNN